MTDLKIGDYVHNKKTQTRGYIYDIDSTTDFFKLVDEWGNPNSKEYRPSNDFKLKAKETKIVSKNDKVMKVIKDAGRNVGESINTQSDVTKFLFENLEKETVLESTYNATEDLKEFISWYKKIYFQDANNIKAILNRIEKGVIVDKKTDYTDKELKLLKKEIDTYRTKNKIKPFSKGIYANLNEASSVDTKTLYKKAKKDLAKLEQIIAPTGGWEFIDLFDGIHGLIAVCILNKPHRYVMLEPKDLKEISKIKTLRGLDIPQPKEINIKFYHESEIK